MKLIQSSNDRQTTMIFTGALDLSHASQAHQALAEAIRNYAHVAVKVMRVEMLDVSFLQLICAAHRTALSQKKRFTLTMEDPHHIKNLMVGCGLQHHCGCDAEAAAPCIWQVALFHEAPDHPDVPPETAERPDRHQGRGGRASVHEAHPCPRSCNYGRLRRKELI